MRDEVYATGFELGRNQSNHAKRKNNLKNVVNCRAWFLLLSAVDHEIFSILQVVFDLSNQRLYDNRIYFCKLDQIFRHNRVNVLKLDADVYKKVSFKLRTFKLIPEIKSKDVQKFRRQCDKRNWTFEVLWTKMTGNTPNLESLSRSISLDGYKTSRQCHHAMIQKLDARQELSASQWFFLNFISFDYENHLIKFEVIKLVIDVWNGVVDNVDGVESSEKTQKCLACFAKEFRGCVMQIIKDKMPTLNVKCHILNSPEIYDYKNISFF